MLRSFRWLLSRQPFVRKVQFALARRRRRRSVPTRIGFDRPTVPRWSVIIPAYGQLEMTRACLQHLMVAVQDHQAEVIVVDDCSPGDALQSLAEVPGLRYLSNPVNVGFLGSVNRGAKEARGRRLLFLNNDTEVFPDVFQGLEECFRLHSKAGIVGASLVYADGTLQEAGGLVFRDGGAANRGKGGDPLHPSFRYSASVHYVSGAALAIERSLFERLDGFDPYFSPAYYEDTDLAQRVRALELEVRVAPRAKVLHLEGRSNGTSVSSGVKRYQVENRQKFAVRHQKHLEMHPPPGVRTEPAHRQHRPHILFVDDLVMSLRVASGGHRLVALMTACAREGWHVVFCPMPYHPRNRDCASYLEARGIEVWLPEDGMTPIELLRTRPNEFDLAWLARPDAATKLWRQARRHSPRTRLVYDTVDLHFVREQRQAELRHDVEGLAKAQERQLQEAENARRFDTTIVVSEADAAVLKEIEPSAHIQVVSNIVQLESDGPNFESRRSVLFIGNFSHAPNVDGIEWYHQLVHPLVKAALPDMKLVVVGIRPPASLVADDEVDTPGFVEDLKPLFDSARLSVAPLRFGAGVKGKVNTAMSFGVPIVGSDIAIEGMPLENERDVLISDLQPVAFSEAVIRLYQDRELWTRLRQHSRQVLEQTYGPDRAISVLQEELLRAR